MKGNDAEQDPDRREPPVPVKTVDKPNPRARRVEGAEPAASTSTNTEATRGAGRGGRGGRGRGRGDYSGNERGTKYFSPSNYRRTGRLAPSNKRRTWSRSRRITKEKRCDMY